NFFSDKNIIGAPYPLCRVIVKLIASRRSKGVALEAYCVLGYKSRLLENTLAHQAAMETALKKNPVQGFGAVKVFTTMRYWHPRSGKVVLDVKDYNPAHVVLLPLYPQYSTTTVKSSIEDWRQSAAAHGFSGNTTPV